MHGKDPMAFVGGFHQQKTWTKNANVLSSFIGPRQIVRIAIITILWRGLSSSIFIPGLKPGATIMSPLWG
jgi:hypothetical protein